MKWRVPVAMVAGLLLTLPLLLALGTALHPVRDSVPLGDGHVSPVLSWGELNKRLTYTQPCRSQRDCEPPLACLRINPQGPRYCVASECMTDLQCEAGFTCQALRAVDDGPWVRSCVPIGQRQEGQPCLQGFGIKKNACAQGLLCTGWCGRPCQLDAPESCPSGFYCAQGPDGPSCRPTCEGRTCPSGQQCVTYEGRTSVCAVVRGQNCQRHPCAEGQECKLYYPRIRDNGLLMGMECVQPCEEGQASCPEGLVCAHGACRRPCEPGAPATCGPDEVCTAVPGKPGVCQLQRKD